MLINNEGLDKFMEIKGFNASEHMTEIIKCLEDEDYEDNKWESYFAFLASTKKKTKQKVKQLD